VSTIQIKYLLPIFLKKKHKMSFTLESPLYSSIDTGSSSRKRNIGVLEESEKKNCIDLLFLPTKNVVNQSNTNKTRRVSADSELFSNGNNTIIPPTCTTTATISNKIDTENSRSLDTHRLVSFCGSSTGTSTSCEESACSSSNYSEQQEQEQQACYSEVLSSSDTVTQHHNTRRRKRRDNKKDKWQHHTSPKNNKTKKRQDDSLSSTSTSSSHNKFNNNSKVKGQYAAPFNPSLHSNFWDDSSWSCSKSKVLLSSSIKKKKKKNNCRLATRGSNYTISKVEGLITATSNPLNSKTWENTNWKLRPISRINDTGKDAIDDNNDITEMEMEMERRQNNNNINDCNMPRENSVQWKLWKRLNEPDPQKRIFLLQAPITRVNTTATRLLTGNQPFEDKISSIGSPYILYRWLRVRLAAGLVRSCFDYLHQIIKKNYDEVEDVLKKLEISPTHNEELASLVTIRDRLAGIWCVYAHFTLEVGCLALEEKMKKSSLSSQKKNKYMRCLSPRDNTTVLCNPNVISETDSDFADNNTVASELELYNRQSRPVDNDRRKRIDVTSSGHQENITYEDISNHAISILLTARDCPLVGNHTAIALSLGRMIVSSTVMEQSKADCTQLHLSKENMSAKIKSAIDVCWDNIDTCRSKSHHQSKRRFTTKPVSKTTLRLLSNFEIKNQKLYTEKRIKKDAVLDGIESTLTLPSYIRNSLSKTSLPSDGVVIGDRNTIRCLSVELNRWSRLGEELETNHDRTIRLTPFHEPELPFLAAELPMFAPVESLSDPLKLYGDTEDAAKTIIWQW